MLSGERAKPVWSADSPVASAACDRNTNVPFKWETRVWHGSTECILTQFFFRAVVTGSYIDGNVHKRLSLQSKLYWLHQSVGSKRTVGLTWVTVSLKGQYGNCAPLKHSTNRGTGKSENKAAETAQTHEKRSCAGRCFCFLNPGILLASEPRCILGAHFDCSASIGLTAPG